MLLLVLRTFPRFVAMPPSCVAVFTLDVLAPKFGQPLRQFITIKVKFQIFQICFADLDTLLKERDNSLWLQAFNSVVKNPNRWGEVKVDENSALKHSLKLCLFQKSLV